MEQWFENKVALITGGGDGIGRAAAQLFAHRGAKVVIADVNRKTGAETVEMIRHEGGEAIFVGADVTDRSAVAALIAQAIREFGRLDCAFNNAGILHPQDGNWDDATFDRIIDVNLKGVMNCMKAQIPVMLTGGGGAIVNTASVAGLIASAAVPQPGYTASKHAVIGLTKTAALQYARRNIRINALCPGVTETQIVREAMVRSPEARSLLENFAPMGRMARAQEMAEAAIWLCSDKASYVTGHSMVVDGGFLAT